MYRTILSTVSAAGLVLSASSCARYVGPAETISFVSSDGIALEGTLVTPNGASGELPGVVILHGAEPATRSLAYRMHANVFVEKGMAVLLYDKRGAGASEGDHDQATYALLADDGLAALDWLRRQPGIDPARIAVVSASESGWFTPEIAERAGGLAFAINKSGPCSSWRQTVGWEVYNELLDEGVAAEAAHEQVELLQRVWAWRISPTSEDQAALEVALAEWARIEGSVLPTELKPMSEAYVQDISYDPGPWLERTMTPMLYVYGEHDPVIPVAQCVERLTELQSAGLPVSFYVFEGQAHEIGGLGWRGYQFADGYAERLGAFAEQHMAAPQPLKPQGRQQP